MSNKNTSNQDSFLNKLRKEHVPVSIYLVNGIKIQGEIQSFDQYTIIIAAHLENMMVYKHAVTTVVPGRLLQINHQNEEENTAHEKVQDVFLDVVKKSQRKISIYLVNGIKLSGVVSHFDQHCLLLTDNRSTQMVYKHNISTVVLASAP